MGFVLEAQTSLFLSIGTTDTSALKPLDSFAEPDVFSFSMKPVAFSNKYPKAKIIAKIPNKISIQKLTFFPIFSIIIKGKKMDNLERTIQAIKDLDSIISVKEWNKIAMQYNYLSSCSLKRLFDMNFRDLCIKIRKTAKN